MTSALLTVPLDLLESMQDHGRWREAGVTHWHCLLDEQPITVNGRPNEARFSTDRIRHLVNDQPTLTARSPREALEWLLGLWTDALNDPRRCPDPSAVLKQRLWHTEEMWEQQIRHTWDILTTSVSIPAGCGVQIRANYSLDCHAYPMTSARCRRHV